MHAVSASVLHVSYVRDCASWNFAIAGLSASVGVMLVRGPRRSSAAPQRRSLSQQLSARTTREVHYPGKFSGVDRRLVRRSLEAPRRQLTQPLNFAQKRGFALIAAIGQMRAIVASFCQISRRERNVHDDLFSCGSAVLARSDWPRIIHLRIIVCNPTLDLFPVIILGTCHLADRYYWRAAHV